MLFKIENYLKNKLNLFLSVLSLTIISTIIIFNLKYSTSVYANWYPLLNPINYASYFIVIILFIITFWILKIKNNQYIYFTIVLIQSISFILRLFLIQSFNNTPVADSWYILDSVNVFLVGDMSPFWKGSYLLAHQHQLGLATILIPFVSFFKYHINQYYFVNLLSIQLAIIFLTLSAKELKGIRSALFVTVLLNLFLPNIWMTFFIYGDVYAFFFLSLVIFILSKYYKKLIWRHYLVIALLLSAAYLSRAMVNISLIALSIALILNFKWNKFLILKVFAVLSLLIIPIKINESVYHQVFDVDLNQHTLPTNTWLRIGLSYNSWSQTPGFYDVQVDYDFQNSDFSTVLMSSVNYEIIKERLTDLSNLSESLFFFYKKIVYEWTDPDFESITLLFPYPGFEIDNPADLSLTKKYGSGGIDVTPTNNFGSWIQNNSTNILTYEKGFYIFILLNILIVFIRNKNDFINTLFKTLLIGLFLFFLLFEIKSRYLWLYFNFYIFYVAMNLPTTFENILNYLKDKRSFYE